MSIYDPESSQPAWLPSREDAHAMLTQLRQIAAAAGDPLRDPTDYQRLIDQTADYYHLALDLDELIGWLYQEREGKQEDTA